MALDRKKGETEHEYLRRWFKHHRRLKHSGLAGRKIRRFLSAGHWVLVMCREHEAFFCKINCEGGVDIYKDLNLLPASSRRRLETLRSQDLATAKLVSENG